MAVGHHVVAPRRDHSHDRVQQRGLGAQPVHTAHKPHVGGDLVIGEDRRELLLDLVATAHLAAVEADHDRVVTEMARVRRRVPLIPRRKNAGVQLIEPGVARGSGHDARIDPRSPPAVCGYAVEWLLVEDEVAWSDEQRCQLGMGVVPRSLTELEGPPVEIRGLEPPARLSVALVWRRERHRAPAAQAFIDFVRRASE